MNPTELLSALHTAERLKDIHPDTCLLYTSPSPRDS